MQNANYLSQQDVNKITLGKKDNAIVAIPAGVVQNVKVLTNCIYTTNSIESFNRQLRKVTKSKTIFPTDDSLLKMLYLATVDITKKWTSNYRE